MSSFTKSLTTTYVGKGFRKVARSFVYFAGKNDGEETIKVPAGFVTDFASVPFPASMLIPKDGDYNQAAVLHDYLYSKLGNIPERKYKRAQCDKIFIQAMRVLGVSRFKRHVMYRAVRLGGGFGWNKHLKIQKKKNFERMLIERNEKKKTS